MKKPIFTIALMLIAMLTLASCIYQPGKDGELEQEVETTVKYTIKCSQEFIDAIDLIVTYKDKEGYTVTDTVSDMTWVKTVVNEKVPVTIGMDWVLQPKTDSKNKVSKEYFDHLLAACEIECKEADLQIGNDIVNLHHFPTNKLEALCELETFKQVANWTDGHEYYTLKPYILHQGIKWEEADWHDVINL